MSETAIMENLYESAKKEYELEDEDGKHRLVYAYFGLAIYTGQCLEEAFSLMLWTDRVFKQKVRSQEEVNEIIDAIENSRKTMGRFINEVKQNYNLTTEIVAQLDQILEMRNYLTHKYFKLQITKFYSEFGQLEMIKYFCDFINSADLLEKQLKRYYTTYTNKLGLTEERITQIMHEMKEQEIKRTSK